MKLSVIVCTTNQRPELEKCLTSIKIEDQTEIIVINNSQSKIATHVKVKTISEKISGLSQARNTGWQKAKGEYVAYIDDDAVADKNWVRNILIFIKKYPQVAAFGGPFYRHSPTPIPFWLPLNYGLNKYEGGVRKLSIGQEFLNGTNMIFRRSLLKKMGGFNPSFGMIGEKVFYGEETELQLRLAKQGIDVWYDPKIHVSHLVPKRKMNVGWIIREAFITGQATQQMMKNYQDVFQAARRPQKRVSAIGGSILQKSVRLLQLTSYAAGRLYQGMMST